MPLKDKKIIVVYWYTTLILEALLGIGIQSIGHVETLCHIGGSENETAVHVVGT